MKNKIIIVGHPFSGYLDIEKQLKKSGVAIAQPSRQEGITAVEIGSVLCRAHGVLPVGQLRLEDRIDQVSVGAVWNGMALDLLRGNLDHPLWCWSDPQAIYFLEYWKQLDPSLVFVLVYNHPRTILSQDPEGAYDLTSEDLEQRVHQWHTYNEALLHFFYRNKDRSLLLHAQQASVSADSYVLKMLSSVIEFKSMAPDSLYLSEGGAVVSEGEQSLRVDNLPVVHRYWMDHFSGGRENQLKQFIAGELVENQYQSLQLYEELQAVANLPAEEAQEESSGCAMAAWRVFADLYKQSQILGEQSLEKQQYIDVLEYEQQLLNNQIGEKSSQLQQAEKRAQERTGELQQENDLLLTQLHQVQEELETKYLQGQEAESKLLEVERQLSQQQKKLEERLTQKKADAELSELRDENELLLLQLHQVQEELERYYLENRELKNNQQPVYYGAADRLKSDLTYQLGAAIMNASRKVLPLPFLPLILWRVAKRVRKQQEGQSLPELTEYRDYHEAEKVQKHLSYRLGTAWLRHIRTPWGWIYMPFALIGARIAYRRDRKAQGK